MIPIRRHEAGMSVVELMVTVALGSVIAAMMVGMLIAAQRAMTREASVVSRTAAARFAINEIAKCVETAFPLPDGSGGVLFTGVDFGNTDILTAVTPSFSDEDRLALTEVRYGIRKDEGGGSYLTREQRVPGSNAAFSAAGQGLLRPAPSIRETPYVDATLELAFRASLTGDWQPSWQAANLPAEVRVRVEFTDARLPNDSVALETICRPRTRLP